MKKSSFGYAALGSLLLTMGISSGAFACSGGVDAGGTAAGDAGLYQRLNYCAGHAHHANIPPSAWEDGDPTSDEIVIDFKDSVPNSKAIAIGKAWGLDLHLNSKYSDDANIFIAKVPEGAVPAYEECMKSIPEIEGIEEDFRVQAFGVNTPNDPLYPFQWDLQQVNAEKAWAQSTGKGVTVAVIDTGVALEDDASRGIKAVKDLEGTGYVEGYDFVDDDDFPWDGHGHGTHVAGTIAQTTNNGYGVAGLAYNADIMPLRVLNSEGYGSVTDIADAIRFAADNGAQVINMSLGGPLPSLVMSRAINYAHKKGVTIVAAAGNSGRREVSYPAAYKHVIAVAATQYDRSTTFYSQYGNFVDIAAPGGNTRVDQNNDGRPDGVMQETLKEGHTDQHEFALYMGTSMASPHVAAVAAMIISKGVTNPDRVEAILKNTASTSEQSRYSNPKEYQEHYGAGIVQADAAVASATETPGMMRLVLALLLSFFAFGASRRKDSDLFAIKPTPLFFLTLLISSSGLFFLPNLIDGLFSADPLPILGYLSTPFEAWDTVSFGPAAHQNPLLASALLPLLGVMLLGVNSRWRQSIAGLSLGVASYCFVGALLMNSDVTWIPGMAGLLDRAWLLINGLVATGLGFLSLQRH